MTSMDKPNIPLAQMYPSSGWEYQLNCCANPDCGNFGVEPEFLLDRPKGRNARQEREFAIHTSNAFATGHGLYNLAGASSAKKHARTTTAFEYEMRPCPGRMNERCDASV